MPFLVWVSAFCALAIGVPSVSRAQAPSASSKTGSVPGPFSSARMNGEIRGIDKQARTITIDQSGRLQTLRVDDRSTVFLEGRLGSLDDLREGQQVRAAYEERGTERSLRWIEVNPTPTAKPEGSGVEPVEEDATKRPDAGQ